MNTNKNNVSLFLLIIAIFFGFSAIAQTQKIAHKSHSGKTSNFKIDLNSKNNIGIPSGIGEFMSLKRDSIALLHFLKDSTLGQQLYELIKNNEKENDFSNYTRTEEGRTLLNNINEEGIPYLLRESIFWYNYNEVRTYILELMDRHKEDKKETENSNGTIFFDKEKYQNYASTSIFIGILCVSFWLYKESKITV